MASSRKLDLTPEAEADLADIWRYTADVWDEAQAETYLDLIRAKLDLMARFPKMGRSRDELAPGLRCYPAEEHIVFDRFTAKHLIVRRILHHRQDVSSARDL